MTESHSTPPPGQVDPQRLSLLLQQSGWRLVGQRRNAYIRLVPPSEDRVSVLVPLDRDAPEFEIAMRAALFDLERMAVREMQNIFVRLTTEPADSFKFRVESAAPSGLIAWTQGEALVRSARLALVAGAKSYMERLQYFNNRFGQFAKRYLDTVLMGQTAPGSYIVTAFAPASAHIARTAGDMGNTLPLFGKPEDTVSTRDIGLSIVRAVEATVEAVEHYRQTASLTAFEGLVSRGVSYEMAIALSTLAEGSDGAEVAVEWDPAIRPSPDAPSSRFEIRPSDVDILTKGGNLLAAASPTPKRVITGRVHLLSRSEAGGPGVIGVENLSREKPKRVRVHLRDTQYYNAIQAHREDCPVVIEGTIEREGNVHWIYDGSLLSVLPSLNEIREQITASGSEVSGQLEISLQELAERSQIENVDLPDNDTTT